MIIEIARTADTIAQRVDRMARRGKTAETAPLRRGRGADCRMCPASLEADPAQETATNAKPPLAGTTRRLLVPLPQEPGSTPKLIASKNTWLM